MKWIATLLGSIALALTVHATCGGGGGGGAGGSGQAYKTTWTSMTLEQALLAAEKKKQGVLIYFRAQRAKEHRFFRTKMPNDASKERLFLKVDIEEGEALRKEFGVKNKPHFVYVCDWYGNTIKDYKARDKSKFNGKQIKAALYRADKFVKKLSGKLDKKLKAAQNAAERASWPVVIKALNNVLVYKGYPAVAKAEALWKQVMAAGEAELDAAARLEGTEKRKKLNAIKRTFKGTPIATRCDEELGLKRKRGTDDPPEEQSRRLGDEAFVELFKDLDQTPSVDEQIDEALRAGLEHENAGRYRKALASYALAAGLDPNDSVPLAYLGELYRHHLGEWDRAESAFERILELDNDDHAVAIALHGIGKMTIWRGDNEKGLAFFARSLARHPTALCNRNLAVYWNTEGDAKKAFEYASAAYRLAPADGYNRVFYAVYLFMNGNHERAKTLIERTEFHASMSYNFACYYAAQNRRDLALRYLRKHFYEYESNNRVRSFEMAEARMDAFFAKWYEDPDFKELTALAGHTPWLEGR